MADRERRDIQTRFKAGQSGNPKGRPKGRKNNAGLLSDAFFKTVRIKDAQGIPETAKAIIGAMMAPNEKVEAWGRLPEAAVKALELKPGDFKQG